MAYIQKRQRNLKDGSPGPVRWIARYRDLDGRERSQDFSRRKDAEKFLERNGTDLQHGTWIDPDQERTPFSEWADAWWSTTVKLQPNTRRGYGTISPTVFLAGISKSRRPGIGRRR